MLALKERYETFRLKAKSSKIETSICLQTLQKEVKFINYSQIFKNEDIGTIGCWKN